MILCGIDFSGESTDAAKAALAFARVLGTELELVHVVSGTEGMVDATNAAAAEAKAKLEAVRALFASSGAPVTASVIGGSPSTALVKLAAAKSADLLVLGARGISDSSWLVGSVAERTALAATVPAILVRDPAPFVEWAAGARPLKIFFAADTSADSRNAAPFVARLAAAKACTVTVGHSAWPPDVHGRLKLEGPMPLDALRPEAKQTLESELRAHLADVPGFAAANPAYEASANFGRCADHLVEMATKASADLVITGMQQRSTLGRIWHGSISWGVMQSAPMSVLSVATS